MGKIETARVHELVENEPSEEATESSKEIYKLYGPAVEAQSVFEDLQRENKEIEQLEKQISVEKAGLSALRKENGEDGDFGGSVSLELMNDKIAEAKRTRDWLEEKMRSYAGDESEAVIEVKGNIPENVYKRFDVGEIIKISRNNFAQFLQKTEISTLAAYLRMGKIDLKKLKAPKKVVDLVEREGKKPAWTINPKLYFLSKAACAELALDELMSRLG